MSHSALLCIWIFALFSLSTADNHYKDGDIITLWVDKVGPIDNPQETYEYFSLPFCRPAKKIEPRENLGEAVQGYELTGSPLVIQFKTDLPTKSMRSNETEILRDQPFRICSEKILLVPNVL